MTEKRPVAAFLYALGIVCAASLAVSAASAVQDARRPSRPPDIYYTPTRQVVAEAMLTLAGVTDRDVVFDLGSGDGRLVILAAQLHGARGVGIEIQPDLVERARMNAVDAEVAERVRFVEGDLYTADVSEATVVLLYLSVGVTREITPKLLRELRPGARIVSQQFRLADVPPERVVTVEGAELFLWTVPPR
jgi:SAM-dependent methyltransferase